MTKNNHIAKFLKKNYKGWLFVSPLILGIMIFNIYPMLNSVVYSMCDYDIINPPTNFGFQNFIKIFTTDPNFWIGMRNSAINAFIQVPLAMVCSYLLALSLKKRDSINGIFRIIFYLPVLIPGVVSGLIYNNMFAGSHSYFNTILGNLGIGPISFLEGNRAMASIIYIQLTSIGGGMVIWLAAFNGIPDTLYEAAEIDGATKIKCLFAITIPMTTPAIFYNWVMGFIGNLQIFDLPYNLVGPAGGSEKCLYFAVMDIYSQAFQEMQFSLAAAKSLVLFLFIGILTFFNFRLQKWINYGEDS